MTDELVSIGRVLGAHGLDGQVAIRGENADPMELAHYGSILWIGPRGAQRTLSLTECRPHKGVSLVRFEGVVDREGAEDLIGGLLKVPRSELRPLPEGAIYIIDLVGMMVVTVDGREVGRLTQVYGGGAQDIYGVDAGGREVLIPAIEPIVTEVDREKRRIVIDPPEGLLD